MKYLKLYNEINEEINFNFLRDLNIKRKCEKYNIENFTINSDGTIDVDGNVDLWRKNLIKLPLKFNKVNGYFDCYNHNLTSLEGCPNKVNGWFDCSWNKLTSLVDCPERVGGDFCCQKNNIRDFEGFPKYLGGEFYCYGNPIYQVWKLFEDKDKIELFNDYDIIRDDVIIMDRLNDFLMEIGKHTVTEVNGYKCI